MKNFFIVAMFLIIFSSIFYILYDKKKDNIFKLNTCLPLKCDLNSQDCTFSFNGKQILVSAYPKPIKIFKNTAIKVSNFPFNPNLKIKIYSLNSYIGNIIPQFTNTKDAIIINFTGKSVTDDSRFRVEFLNNDKPTGFFFDFDVTLQKIYNSAILPQN